MITASAVPQFFDLPCIIKSFGVSDTKEKERFVVVEASCEKEDQEGDIILQSALLDAAPDFIRSGDLDIDHLSKHGHKLGIQNPEKYIVGMPRKVYDAGDKRTEVVGEIFHSSDNSFNPQEYVYDWFWETITNPSKKVNWRASIYGQIVSCQQPSISKRYTVSKIIWTSLAFTQHPVNDDIQREATLMTPEEFHAKISKSMALSIPLDQLPGKGWVDKAVSPEYPAGGINTSTPITRALRELGLPTVEEVFCEYIKWRCQTGRVLKPITRADVDYFMTKQYPMARDDSESTLADVYSLAILAWLDIDNGTFTDATSILPR